MLDDPGRSNGTSNLALSSQETRKCSTQTPRGDKSLASVEVGEGWVFKHKGTEEHRGKDR
jgi:hypothetical protein